MFWSGITDGHHQRSSHGGGGISPQVIVDMENGKLLLGCNIPFDRAEDVSDIDTDEGDDVSSYISSCDLLMIEIDQSTSNSISVKITCDSPSTGSYSSSLSSTCINNLGYFSFTEKLLVSNYSEIGKVC